MVLFLKRLLFPGLAGVLLLASCSSSQKTTSKPLSMDASRHPLFLDHATMNGKRTSGIRVASGASSHRKTAKSAEYQPAQANALQAKYAVLLNTLPQAISNYPLYAFIDAWFGTRYRYGGNDHDGIDCSAFVQRLYENVFGMSLVRTALEQFNMTRMLWDVTELREGDLVFFRTQGNRISHVGVYLMNNYFVHSSSSQGVTISSLTENYWRNYFAGAGRVL